MKRTLQLCMLLLAVALATCLSAQAATKPVRVFILAGQSNMEGHGIVPANPKNNGGKGSLEGLVKDPATTERFAALWTLAGNGERDDVWITYLVRKGPLTVGFGATPEMIGPELGFGWVLGDALHEPILLVKCAGVARVWRLIFVRLRAGKPPYSLGAKGDAEIAQNPAVVGKYYRETVSLTKAALANVKELVPGSDGSYVLSGFGWHQGWNDRINEKFNAEYESNMAHFIADIRQDLALRTAVRHCGNRDERPRGEESSCIVADESAGRGCRTCGIQRNCGVRGHQGILASERAVAQRARFPLELERRNLLPHWPSHGRGDAAADRPQLRFNPCATAIQANAVGRLTNSTLTGRTERVNDCLDRFVCNSRKPLGCIAMPLGYALLTAWLLSLTARAGAAAPCRPRACQ